MRNLALIVLVISMSMMLRAQHNRGYLLYVGTYTKQQSKGIYVYRFRDGKLTSMGLAAESANPSFLATDPRQRFIFAVNESANGSEPGNTVSAFTIDRSTGRLTLVNRVSSHGDGPCHVSVDETGTTAFVANYGSGSIASFPVASDGTLGEAASVIQHHGSGPDRERQEGPHAHCIIRSPDNRFVVAADLGLDEALVYRFDSAKHTLRPNEPAFGKVPPGAGARHLAFHPNGKYLYVVNEMGRSVTTFAWDAASGALQPLQTVSTLPKDFTGNDDCAEIQVSSDGMFVYASNRGHDSIAVFSVDPNRGTLTPVEYVPTGGKTPRHFTLDPTGRFLLAANEDSNSITVFRINRSTGKLSPTGEVADNIEQPVCLLFVGASE